MRSLIKTLARWLLAPLPLPRHPTLSAPGLHLGWRWGWVKGWLVRPLWAWKRAMGGTRLVVGRRFSLQGKLQCSGPGTVVFGDDVIVGAHATPFTHDRRAVIEIGSRCFVNGTRFGCAARITVGDECILADARIMDTDFHAVHRRRNEPGMAAETAPVRIGRNVWIAAGSSVLKGVEIGDNSVVAFGSVVVKSLPADTVCGGNPARALAPVAEGPSTGGAP